MHAVAPYLFRCFNRDLEGRVEERYSTLDNLGDKDLFYILRDFLQANTGAYKIIEETKQVFQFDELQINEQSREIYGWFNVGTYQIHIQITVFIIVKEGGMHGLTCVCQSVFKSLFREGHITVVDIEQVGTL